LWREPIGCSLNQFEPGKLTPYSQRLIFLIGTSVNRRRYLQNGCPPQRKCWYQKTDVPSPHPAPSYHGCTGRNRGECKKSAETQQTQKFKYLDGVCDNRGPDQRDITDLLDGMKGAIGGGSG
jgi:hypothetical protein